MTHAAALNSLRADLVRGRMISPNSRLVIVERDALRAVLDGGAVLASGTTLGEGLAITTAPPSPTCGMEWGVDVCARPLGHEGECQDEEGRGLEVPF